MKYMENTERLIHFEIPGILFPLIISLNRNNGCFFLLDERKKKELTEVDLSRLALPQSQKIRPMCATSIFLFFYISCVRELCYECVFNNDEKEKSVYTSR